MKFLLSVLLLLSINIAHSQQLNWLNIKSAPFNAVGNGSADDYPAIQAAIDSAIKTNGTVYLPKGTYSISQPLIAATWTGSAYAATYFKMVGEDAMHSSAKCIIRPTFKDGFALGLHLNKGSIITGIYFDGLYSMSSITADSFYKSPITITDPTCRDSQYSPYAGIVIDPFRGVVPPDGGYPTLTSWYRGPDNVSGSTGVRVEDCTFRDFTVGAIVAPNGMTLNAELITFENIRFNDCRVAFAGCQAQEKLNRLINIEVWGRVRIAFGFNLYGQTAPGHYAIDGVNIAGEVVDLVYRNTLGFFPLYMTNVFAESLGRIGYWNTGTTDALTNSTLNFLTHTSVNTKAFIAPHMTGGGVTLMNCQIRYYGELDIPILLGGNLRPYFNIEARDGYVNHVLGAYYSTSAGINYRYGFDLPIYTSAAINWYDSLGIRKAIIADNAPPPLNSIMIINTLGNLTYAGMAKVTSVGSSAYTISYLSPGIVNGTTYQIRLYTSTAFPATSGGTGTSDTLYIIRKVKPLLLPLPDPLD